MESGKVSQKQTQPPSSADTPLGRHSPPSVTCRWYASYWNAFLYLMSSTDKRKMLSMVYHVQSMSRLVLSGETFKSST